MNARSLLILQLCLIAASSPLFASAAEAERYVDSQGIEIIHNHSVAVPLGNNLPSNILKAGVFTQLKAAVAENNQSSRGTKLQITKKEQQKRDGERLEILNQELMAEASAFQTKWKALNTPNMKLSMGNEQAIKLQQSLNENEKNIRLLTSEINNTKKGL